MGNKCGDILGVQGNLLCVDLTARPYNLFSSGEVPDIVNHEKIPFKGLGTSVGGGHTNFVNQIRVSPDNTRFASVSSDKKINIVDTKSKAILASTDGAHAMGIYDVAWLDDERIVTSSADNTVKLWKVPKTEGPMEELHQFRQTPEGTKADPKMQVLGVLSRA